MSFVRADEGSFPFILIDPTGWAGFALDTITPLLRLEPSEVLINFMTGHIRRFLDSPLKETQQSFSRLFGSARFRERMEGIEELDREDAAVQEYGDNLRRVGRFPYSCSAIVLHPEMSRTHFHLIYATRSFKGVEVFKDTEKKGQFELLRDTDLHDSSHYNSLRGRYLRKMRDVLSRALQQKERLLYDDAWALVLSNPLTWESDLKQWIADEHIALTGLAPKQRVPHLGKQNFLMRSTTPP